MAHFQHSSASYFNRELSLFAFNRRVLAQAAQSTLPVLERLNFLMIFSRNLDEFFEIRIAGLMKQIALKAITRTPDAIPIELVMAELATQIHHSVAEQYRLLNQEILPALAEHGIRFIQYQDIAAKHRTWLEKYFRKHVQPVLTPISLDPSHPFPRLVNKSLNFIVSLEGKDAFGRQISMAIVPAPRSLPRLIQIPPEVAGSPYEHIFLSAILQQHIDDLFPGMRATGCYAFRVTRNADLVLAEDVDDLAVALKDELSSRRFGQAVRLEIEEDCPQEIIQYLLNEFSLTKQALYRIDGPINLARMTTDFALPALKYQPYLPIIPKIFRQSHSMFDVLKKQDVLLHHPFESFQPVINLLKEAAKDPNVLAIKQTLYRSGVDSEIVQVLAEAARNGKEVTAVIELRARFDEESNILVANLLQEAGAVVVYGIVGYKTHAKMMLIVRREEQALRRYVHLGTGNYHAGNAKMYTDYGLMTTAADMTEDVHRMFQELTGMGKMAKLKHLLHAPFTLHSELLKQIHTEIEFAKSGKKARIIIKVNALTEPELIAALYQASQAGVQVELIIRSICCLIPGLAGLSENIQVRSIVGRFLEHTRVYYFEHAGEGVLYCASADWMGRNLFSRVETAFPILDAKIKKRIIQDGLLNYLNDNQTAWILQSDGQWQAVQTDNTQPIHHAQNHLMQKRLLKI